MFELEKLTEGDLDKDAIAHYIRNGITSPRDLGPLISFVVGDELYTNDDTVVLDVEGTEVCVGHAGDGHQFGVSFMIAGQIFHFLIGKELITAKD